MATYSARLADDGRKGWQVAAKTTSIVINGVNQGTPDRTSDQGWGGMWGEWDIKDNSCMPKWGSPKKDRCIGMGRATYSARLASDAGLGWEAAARGTSITINGVNQGTPNRVSNQGVGGMWGEWDIADNSCTPKWMAAKKDRCIGNGRATYSARLASDAGLGWTQAARQTSITINGVNQGTPDRISNQGVGGMWGEWDISDNSCQAKWGTPKKDDCRGKGIVQYSARLASDAGMGWDAAARSTSIVINGVNQGPPDRTSNQGAAGGMWGEWDVPDDSCTPKWMTPKKDDCKGQGIVQYSARLSTDAGMGWEIAAKTTSIVINGVNQGTPYRINDLGVGGMWGEWDVPDSACQPRWMAAKNDGCRGIGIVQYSARLASDAGMGWQEAADVTPITINGVNQGTPDRTNDLGVGGMWGEWDVPNNTCTTSWYAPKKDDCSGDGTVQYSARLEDDAGMGWQEAADVTPITINGILQGTPVRTSNQGIGGMWGEWDVADYTCHYEWGFFGEITANDFGYEPPVNISGADRIRGWSWDGKMASYVFTEPDGNGGQRSSLSIQDFDGVSLSKTDIPAQEFTSSDNIAGWNWDGQTASYVYTDDEGEKGRSVLVIRPFDGETFDAVTTTIDLTKNKNVKAWSWDGQEANYVAQEGDEFKLYSMTFDGENFGPVAERVLGNLSYGEIRGLNVGEDYISMPIVKDGVTEIFFSSDIQRNRGLLPNSEEDRAFVKKITGSPDRTPQPGTFVLNMPPIGSQGSEGSCLAWAIGYGLMSYEKHRSTGVPYTTNGEYLHGVASPEYLFNRINSRNDSCKYGSWFVNTLTHRGGLNVLQEEGTVDWIFDPYTDDNGCGEVPNYEEPVNPLAALNKITSFAFVQNRSETSLKNLLNDGFPIAIGVKPSNEFDSAGEGFIWKNGIGDSGHAMVIMGYDDDKHAYKIQNSWGTNWGDDGYGWIDYDFLKDSLNGQFDDYYIVYTDKPKGYQLEEPNYVTVFNQAGYVAKVDLSYTINGVVREVTEDISLGFTFRHLIPEGAADIRLEVEGYGVTEPLDFVRNYSGSKINACYKLWGTIFNTRIGEIDCSY